MDPDKAYKIAQFSAVTGADPEAAETALISSGWNLEQAASLYMAAGDDSNGDDEEADEQSAEPGAAESFQNRTSAASTRGLQKNKRPKQMTMQDLQRGGEEADNDDDEKPQDMFAGGEKSGLAVQNPNQGGSDGPIDHFRNIMNQARANRERPESENEAVDTSRPSHFQGRAQTLGGDEVESQVIEDPQDASGQRQRPSRITRTLHLWADGVSIDDGPLFRFDDPRNEHIMAQINQGRAPLSLLNVQPDQEVDLNLDPHKDKNYEAPKRVYKPFSGQGQRLGSPTPALASSSASASAAAAAAPTRESAAPASSGTQASTAAAEVSVDDTAPVITLQIRLGNGTRLSSRFNTTHTIGTVYEFVNRASAASTQRPYVLMTTFPSRELDDKTLVLGDISDFKRGGVVVQKWK